MTDIIVIGGESDTALEKAVKSTLTATYRIIYTKSGEFFVRGRGYELLFYDSPSPLLLSSESLTVIAKRDAVLPRSLPPESTVIFNADCPGQAAAVFESGAFAVDCGFSPTNTVSFSSESDDTLVVSLNRSITALSGRTIQPLELPVPGIPGDEYTAMSFTALRLLLDDFDSELGRLI